MQRRPNTNRIGGNWTEEQKKAVWLKGSVIPDKLSSVCRQDKCGRVMRWAEHGNRNSEYGWEIDHIKPVSNYGGDELSNLQPLHWENNSDKSDKLYWNCPN